MKTTACPWCALWCHHGRSCPLASILGFGADAQALMMAHYIAMDNLGTGCNVSGYGAIALAFDTKRQ